MKKLIISVILILFAGTAQASDWCQWDGFNVNNCQSDSRGYILINGIKTKTVSVANSKGWFKVIVVNVALGPDQVKSNALYSFDDANQEIRKTWEIRDLSPEEITQRTAQAMSLNDFWQWKTIATLHNLTAQQMANVLPPDLVEAYLARKAIEDAQP